MEDRKVWRLYLEPLPLHPLGKTGNKDEAEQQRNKNLF